MHFHQSTLTLSRSTGRGNQGEMIVADRFLSLTKGGVTAKLTSRTLSARTFMATPIFSVPDPHVSHSSRPTSPKRSLSQHHDLNAPTFGFFGWVGGLGLGVAEALGRDLRGVDAPADQVAADLVGTGLGKLHVAGPLAVLDRVAVGGPSM